MPQGRHILLYNVDKKNTLEGVKYYIRIIQLSSAFVANWFLNETYSSSAVILFYPVLSFI